MPIPNAIIIAFAVMERCQKARFRESKPNEKNVGENWESNNSSRVKTVHQRLKGFGNLRIVNNWTHQRW